MSERRMVFIPAYNCERQIARVLAQFTPEVQSLVSEIVVIDNRSTDATQDAALAGLAAITGCAATLLQNNRNYGLGGSHKVAFAYALAKGYDYCLVLHGDDQGHIKDILPQLGRGAHRQVACLLGARFMPGSRLEGYSILRTFGNLVFNLLFSLASGRAQWDLGSGLACFSRDFMQSGIFQTCSDDLTFNYTLQLQCAAAGVRQRFFPVSWRETDQISNVKLVRQTWQMIKILTRYVVRRSDFVKTSMAHPEYDYTATLVATHPAADQPSAARSQAC